MNDSSSAIQSSLPSSISGAGGGGGGGGGGTASASALDDFRFPPDLISVQDRKDEALLVLKADLMAALNMEVKSMEEESWKYEGPRSRIHLISKHGSFLHKHPHIPK